MVEDPDTPLRTALSRGPAPFTELAARYLEEYEQKIRLAVSGLTTEQVWWRPNEASNSVGNLLLHLRGNLSLWILSGLAGIHFPRDRRGEFAARESHTRHELVELLAATVRRCRSVLEAFDASLLDVPASIQGYETDHRGALFHAVEHMSYHTGQVLWIAKQLGGPLELYPRHRGE
jgi:uncharacterized damage-inducible protein DinB